MFANDLNVGTKQRRMRGGPTEKSCGSMKHYWLELPGPVWFSGADIYRRFVAAATSPCVAVELGAWKGRSTAFMGVEIANSGKPIRFYAVDHWRGSPGEESHHTDADRKEGRLFEVFLSNIKPVASCVTVVRSDTRSAAERFEDESVDFLYIDASHTYAGVIGDLLAWYPKVKTGGLIAGDDWCYKMLGEHSVRNAVRDFFGPGASKLVIEPGHPVEDWRQWSIVKTADLQIASARELLFARLRRGAARPARSARSNFIRMLHTLRTKMRP